VPVRRSQAAAGGKPLASIITALVILFLCSYNSSFFCYSVLAMDAPAPSALVIELRDDLYLFKILAIITDIIPL
jgi:hypothetical protein